MKTSFKRKDISVNLEPRMPSLNTNLGEIEFELDLNSVEDISDDVYAGIKFNSILHINMLVNLKVTIQIYTNKDEFIDDLEHKRTLVHFDYWNIYDSGWEITKLTFEGLNDICRSDHLLYSNGHDSIFDFVKSSNIARKELANIICYLSENTNKYSEDELRNNVDLLTDVCEAFCGYPSLCSLVNFIHDNYYSEALADEFVNYFMNNQDVFSLDASNLLDNTCYGVAIDYLDE